MPQLGDHVVMMAVFNFPRYWVAINPLMWSKSHILCKLMIDIMFCVQLLESADSF